MKAVERVMETLIPSFYRESAARCRKAASSSTNPKEWISMAEQWELLGDTEDGSYLSLLFKARDEGERSSDLNSSSL
jgi:hypothetical protein